MSEALIKYETIGLDQIQDIMAGRPVREVSSWRGDSSLESQGTTVGPEMESQDSNATKQNDDGIRSVHEE